MKKAERFAAMAIIPQSLLPITLLYKTRLPQISNITIRYAKKAKSAGPVFNFLRKYGADIRYHNPHLQFIRLCDPNGPLSVSLQLTLLPHNELVRLEPVEFETAEALREKILLIGQQQIDNDTNKQ